MRGRNVGAYLFHGPITLNAALEEKTTILQATNISSAKVRSLRPAPRRNRGHRAVSFG
jgi:hypothetical protein